ncbi:MAG: mismatch-specific DNA-glycosylase [Chloroflexota bacterium]
MTETHSLPDYLRPGLDLVFVGINPGAYSARVGRYFATPQNRFWAALRASGVVDDPRPLEPGAERWLMDVGIGFTDVVKRPSASASDLKAADFRDGVPLLRERLLAASPLLVVFNGLTGLNAYRRHAEGVREGAALGRQVTRIGRSYVYVAPSPSPANAAFSLERIGACYREARQWRDELRRGDA